MCYYQPTVLRDAKKYVQDCDSYQRMGQPKRLDEMLLQPQLVVEPFDRWALNFVGPINPPSKQKFYILVCTDYMTKWVEVVALVKANDQVVIDFMYGEIFTRFGVPKEIIKNGGPQFVLHKLEALLQKYHIQHIITSPYHPQANGQVESTNKVIEAILTKTVRSHHRDSIDIQRHFKHIALLGTILRDSPPMNSCMVKMVSFLLNSKSEP